MAVRWERRPLRGVTARLRVLAVTALVRLGAAPCEVGVLLCGDDTIRALNRRFRGKDRPTDVLSFPDGSRLPEGPVYLGDVAISVDTARRQAEEQGIGVERELETLLLHGLLHLCGFDHERDEGEMAELEARLRQELLP